MNYYYILNSKVRNIGQNGKIGIIGGGPYSGAPALAALGAYRAGIDLVHVFVPANSYDHVSGFIPELIVHKLSGDIVTDEHLEFILDKTADLMPLSWARV